MPLWPHQVYAIKEIPEAIAAGHKRICLQANTGAGKTRIIEDLIRFYGSALTLTNRTMLIEQLAQVLDKAGMYFGMIASGYAPDVFEQVQIASIQSLHKWWKEGRHELPDVKVVFFDEPHNETGQRAVDIINAYAERGTPVVGVTATPVGVGHMFDHLIQAGCTSELRACGALVAARTYAPDEPDSRALKTTVKTVMELRDEVKEVMLPVIYGRVREHFDRLNPDWKPTILFAPGVQESIWFTEKMNQSGIPWSHIDANRIIINGCEMPATRENRQSLLEASRTRKTVGISNRFVLREGIDVPWLEHGIFACTFGGIASYIQSGGRLLRQYYVDGVPQLQNITIQDHGGNFWRHDSLNADRVWSLEDTEKSLKEKHDETYRTKAEQEPLVCPKCSAVRKRGAVCPNCGFAYKGRKRMVIQTDGTLREVRGDIYKPRKVASPEDALIKAWKACVYRCKSKGKTFAQAKGLFMRENNWQVPGEGFPMVPQYEADWALPVGDVPYQRLSK